MTYFEKAVEEIKKNVKKCCPFTRLGEGRKFDRETAIGNGITILGCQGLTCEECWSQQVPNSEDKYAEMEQAVRKFKTEI